MGSRVRLRISAVRTALIAWVDAWLPRVGSRYARWRQKNRQPEMWTTSVTINMAERGNGIPSEQRAIVERLRKQAFAVQHQFELAEHSAVMLDEMLKGGAGDLAAALRGQHLR